MTDQFEPRFGAGAGQRWLDNSDSRLRSDRAPTAIELGLGEKDRVLLALTLFIGAITLGTGRTTVFQSVVHFAIFAVFLFFAIVP